MGSDRNRARRPAKKAPKSPLLVKFSQGRKFQAELCCENTFLTSFFAKFSGIHRAMVSTTLTGEAKPNSLIDPSMVHGCEKRKYEQMTKLLNAARKRGVTLIEAVLFIVIALALMIGGIIFFQQASLSARINDSIRTIVSVQSETRGMFQSSSNFGTADITPALIAAGAVPAKLVSGTTLSNEFGGEITVTGATADFTVLYEDVPSEACVRLTPFSANGQGIAGVGIKSVQIGAGTADTDGMTAAEAATLCTGDVDVTWTFSR